MSPNTNLRLLNTNDANGDADNKLESQFRMYLQHDSENIRSFPRKTAFEGYLNTVGPLVCCEFSLRLCKLSLIFDIGEDHTLWMRHLTSPFDVFLSQLDCAIVVSYMKAFYIRNLLAETRY